MSLVLDKDHFAIGEDIPLRMALKNIAATAEIISGELPCFAGLSFEVHDASGKTVGPKQEMLCWGHGWTIKYPVGNVTPVQRVTLQGVRLLPDKPGEYTLQAIWNAVAKSPDNLKDGSAPYAEVPSNQVHFHIDDRQLSYP